MTDRSPDAVLALIAGMDVASNFAFAPHVIVMPDGTSKAVTWCNAYATCLTAAMGCAIPPKLANKQHAWLASEAGVAAGWKPCDRETARMRASMGFPVVAVWTNPTGPGHISVLVPPPATDPGRIYVSTAGRDNFVRAPLERSFGMLVPEFFTHA